jgi:hypothetical protein
MKNLNKILLFTLSFLLIILSCTEEKKQRSDLEIIRNNNNTGSYPVTTMDSSQAISTITRQKIQELLDLSTLYTSGNRDTEIDSVIYSQMKNYFAEQDSGKLTPLLSQLDSLKVQTAKVGDISVTKVIKGNDTLDFAKFYVEYFDGGNRSIGKFEKNAQYRLKTSPIKFKKEFKFYFVEFDPKPAKDSIEVGVIK